MKKISLDPWFAHSKFFFFFLTIQMKHFVYITSITMLLFHMVTTKTDGLVSMVHKWINILLENVWSSHWRHPCTSATRASSVWNQCHWLPMCQSTPSHKCPGLCTVLQSICAKSLARWFKVHLLHPRTGYFEALLIIKGKALMICNQALFIFLKTKAHFFFNFNNFTC